MNNVDPNQPAYPMPIAANGLDFARAVDIAGAPGAGLSIRAEFAARLMNRQPLFPANLWQAIRWALGFSYIVSRFDPAHEAARAVQAADALIAELNREP